MIIRIAWTSIFSSEDKAFFFFVSLRTGFKLADNVRAGWAPVVRDRAPSLKRKYLILRRGAQPRGHGVVSLSHQGAIR
jgi:hypothetical protein